jgi:gamma-glutamyltranspeptidase/glutathione hydrolase
MRAGGNAVDAAVATAATLAVVEPMMSGLGGDGFYHVYDWVTGRAVVFNGTGPAPAAATPERHAVGMPRIGPLSVSVPGTVAGLGAMHREYGRLPWHDLFAEAIAFARGGFGRKGSITITAPDTASAAISACTRARSASRRRRTRSRCCRA